MSKKTISRCCPFNQPWGRQVVQTYLLAASVGSVWACWESWRWESDLEGPQTTPAKIQRQPLILRLLLFVIYYCTVCWEAYRRCKLILSGSVKHFSTNFFIPWIWNIHTWTLPSVPIGIQYVPLYSFFIFLSIPRSQQVFSMVGSESTVNEYILLAYFSIMPTPLLTIY